MKRGMNRGNLGTDIPYQIVGGSAGVSGNNKRAISLFMGEISQSVSARLSVLSRVSLRGQKAIGCNCWIATPISSRLFRSSRQLLHRHTAHSRRVRMEAGIKRGRLGSATPLTNCFRLLSVALHVIATCIHSLSSLSGSFSFMGEIISQERR